MHSDDWHLTEDVDDLLARAGDFLRSRPALHNTPLTEIEKLRTRAADARRAEGPALFGWLEADGEVRAVFYRTLRGYLNITPLPAGQLDTLAAHLTALGHAPSGVIAEHATATAFAEAWQRHTGAEPVPFWRTHLYRLGTLDSPRSSGREADSADPEQVVRWCREFCVEVGEQTSLDLIDAGSWSESRFGDRHFTIWTTEDGTPASMAARTSLVGGVIRVDPVYTPAPLRGHGYAGAVTAAVSRASLAAGRAVLGWTVAPWRGSPAEAIPQHASFLANNLL
ncbi:GNAT family N-acetyltransferase, partial [Streptomyces sp. NPDC003832]